MSWFRGCLTGVSQAQYALAAGTRRACDGTVVLALESELYAAHVSASET
jgi:hypothetical protein